MASINASFPKNAHTVKPKPFAERLSVAYLIFMSTKEFTEVSNRISADSVKRDFHLKATTKTMKEGIPRPRSSNVLSQDALGSSTVCI